jgi:hypothetical protein
MLQHTLLLLAVVMLSSAGWTKPWFCHENDCPVYSVVSNSTDYEIRNYISAKWVSAAISSTKYTSAVLTGFDKLFQYISGTNVPKKTVPMTSPVLTAINPGAGPFCGSNFTVSFFIPYNLQNGPIPEPTDPIVFIETFVQQTVAVRSFGGFLNTDQDLLDQFIALQTSLEKNIYVEKKDL